jgi:hypothetical protein
MNSLWHTDLHEIQVPDEATRNTYTISVIAFLDDASQFLMHHRLRRDEGSDTCAAVLRCSDYGSSLRPWKRQ